MFPIFFLLRVSEQSTPPIPIDRSPLFLALTLFMEELSGRGGVPKVEFIRLGIVRGRLSGGEFSREKWLWGWDLSGWELPVHRIKNNEIRTICCIRGCGLSKAADLKLPHADDHVMQTLSLYPNV